MDEDNEWCQSSSPLYEVSCDWQYFWPVGQGHLCTIRWGPVQWYIEGDGLEDNSPMDPNQFGDVYQKDTVGQRRLEDWKDTIAGRKFRPTGYQSKGIGEQRDGSNVSREKYSEN